MKSLSSLLSVVLLTSLSVMAFAASDASKPAEKPADQPAPSAAQKSFEELKTLAGVWSGPVTTDLTQKPDIEGKPMQVSLRVTSRGNVLVHEMQEAGTPLDPTRYDHPVTMLYVDSDRLTLVHYCDAGNRPRMLGRTSPDGKTVEFDFKDLSGSNQHGHMEHAVFTIIDANHHTEDWTYMMPGDKPVHAHFDLHKTN